MLRVSVTESKVAQRILVSFLLATLIPIGVLGWLSYQQVNRHLQNQVTDYLRKNTKDYALGLVSRLVQAESELRSVSADIQAPGNKTDKLAKIKAKFSGHFDDLVILPPDSQTSSPLPSGGQIPVLTPQDLQVIETDKVFIKALDSPVQGEKNEIWLAVRLAENLSQPIILLAKLEPNWIWDIENNELDLLWVFNDNNQQLFTSNQKLGLPENQKKQIAASHSGQLTWTSASDTYLGSFWQIPAMPAFATHPMVVVLAQPESLAFESLKQFSLIYPLVISLAVLIVSVLSMLLIGKSLIPLERLKVATQRIANGDFSHRVEISSDDEFEALADSFNEMTERIQGQFGVLSAMAEIDRNILSSTDAEDIIENTLTLLPDILSCDLISIARIDPVSYQVSDIRLRKKGKATEVITELVKFDVKEILSLLEMQNSVIEIGANEKFLALLKYFQVVGHWRYLIVPVVVDGSLASIICLGYQPASSIPKESLKTVRNFGDRIAVALSKAAWEDKLYAQAHYDALTGLPNRLVLNDRLTQEIARAKRDGSEVAVIFIDLDRFKSVNDSLGHSAGDELLTQVAKIFVSCVRETDLVVRIGGDEFVIIITELHKRIDSMLMTSSIGEKILNSLKQTLIVAGQPMTFSASLGIAMYPRDGNNAQDLLKNADAAMYHAKNRGRASFQFYSSDINASALENLKLEHELRHAIAKNELRVFYQPKVEANGKIVGAEALIRWQHAELGMISPAKFIPLAEQSGLIVEIGAWVFEQTCLFVNGCLKQKIQPVRISVNLSVIEFQQPGLVGDVAAILDKTRAKTEFLELEITESVAMVEAKLCIERMIELKKLGMKISMDDFGTGFSSLSYLKDLPLDILKVDQSFMRRVDSEASSQAIVKAILALANGLGLETVAEGVETETQVEFLKNLKCDIFQGFLFYRPMPGDDFMKLLSAA